MNHLLVINRPWEPGTSIVLECECSASEEELRKRFVLAITAWVRFTHEGSQTYSDTEGDFNVGDLAAWEGTESLTRTLERHGITKLSIRTLSSKCYDWEFDTILLDEKVLWEDWQEEEEEEDSKE